MSYSQTACEIRSAGENMATANFAIFGAIQVQFLTFLLQKKITVLQIH